MALGTSSKLAESYYAVIELMLAVCWAIQKCKLFETGLQHFSIIMDHNPLVPISNSYRLDEIENPRLQRLKTRMMSYNCTATWLKGSKNETPDALSRNPVADPEPMDTHMDTLAELDANDQMDISIAELRALHSDTSDNPMCKTSGSMHNKTTIMQYPSGFAQPPPSITWVMLTILA